MTVIYPSSYENRYWKKENETYKLYFRPFDEEECLVSFTEDKENPNFYNCQSELISDEWIEAKHPNDAMQQLEEMILEHYQDEKSYFDTLIKQFSEHK